MKNFILLLIIPIFLFSCTNKDDDNFEPYTPYEKLPSNLIGTWTYKVSGSSNIDATLIFLENSLSVKINEQYYNGKAYRPTSGSDGFIYFKINGKDTYSKISWTGYSSLPYIMRFKIENVENYIIEETFQKKH